MRWLPFALTEQRITITWHINFYCIFRYGSDNSTLNWPKGPSHKVAVALLSHYEDYPSPTNWIRTPTSIELSRVMTLMPLASRAMKVWVPVPPQIPQHTQMISMDQYSSVFLKAAEEVRLGMIRGHRGRDQLQISSSKQGTFTFHFR